MPEMKVELTSRQKQRADRLKLISQNSDVPTIKVWPANEEIRRLMKHPGGTRFRSDVNTAVEWPRDSFTMRRIRDGDAVVGGAAKEQKAVKTEGLNAREIAAARRPKEQPDKPSGNPPSKPAA